MIKTRVIPVLLLRGNSLVKTKKYKNPIYIGDPINTVRIFNEKEVDELVFFDITATLEKREPNYTLLADIASEAFMPMAYGGGITSTEQIRRVLALGFEKVILNSSAYSSPHLITDAANIFGSQCIVSCLDVRQSLLGRYRLYSHSGKIKQSVSINDHVRTLTNLGVGEIIVNCINRDGTRSGYDLKLIKQVSSAVDVPVVASGGASSVADFTLAINQAGASAVAAGSLFVFTGPHNAVLITYPDRNELSGCLP